MLQGPDKKGRRAGCGQSVVHPCYSQLMTGTPMMCSLIIGKTAKVKRHIFLFCLIT